MLGVSDHGFSMIVIHVATDPRADGFGEGICWHEGRGGGAMPTLAVNGFFRWPSGKALPEQQA